MAGFQKDLQYYKFCSYGFLKNLRFFEPFLMLFFLEKGMSFLQIGFLYSIREIATNILEIPTGILADTLGRRKTMIFSFISYIISFFIFFISKNYGIFIISMIFYAFGEAFRTGTHKAMIYEYLRLKGWDKYKVDYYGHTRSSSQIGSAVSSLIAASIVFYSGSYRYIFLFSAIPYILDLVLMITYPKELDGDIVKRNFSDIFKSFGDVTGDFILTLRNPKMIKTVINSSVHGGFYEAAKDFLQPVLKNLAVALPLFAAMENEKRTSLIIGIVYFFIYLLTAIGARNAGNIGGLFKNQPLYLNLTLIIGFSFGLLSGIFYNINLLFVSIIFYVFIYLNENIRKPSTVAYLSESIKKNVLASSLSVESQFKTLFAAIITPLMGFLADKFGVGSSLIITSSVLIIFTPLFSLKKEKTEN
ncbi:MAG TPA: MFS transporter [Tepiditoga sp.]|mgnify:CR=1 FL=1|nr:MFS transporter [Thermotogota bacterium]HOO73930.1 MFS transporter [Tepiditoga sp.]